MQELLKEILKLIAPEIALLIATVVGALIAKLVGVIRAWKLEKQLSGSVQAINKEIFKYVDQGAIPMSLALVLKEGLSNFARNVGQIKQESSTQLERFGQKLQNANNNGKK